MKPRLYKLRGLWHCFSRGAAGRVMGVGYCPRTAYADWEAGR